MYEISYSKASEKYFKKIRDRNLLAAFKAAIDKIKDNPEIGTQKIGDLHGIYGYDVMLNSINYELAYRFYEEKRLVVIILVGTRENFYKELKRLIKS
ncbi:MAG: type II toxin-antitoxin system RelE/ParE family toxin [Deferribacteraceae bacterium]|jgi:mRNA interferase RelE/StbE|nr:type II toxin-antitoxin system RelE/ParE family toxin [Deferribacteraceae bacterium]